MHITQHAVLRAKERFRTDDPEEFIRGQLTWCVRVDAKLMSYIKENFRYRAEDVYLLNTQGFLAVVTNGNIVTVEQMPLKKSKEVVELCR